MPLLGRPSSGKSTLVNAIVGRDVSIVAAHPQTTRNAVRGIYTDDRGQIVFVDTPGIHNSERAFNQTLRTVSLDRIEEADAILYTLDCTRSVGPEEIMIADLVAASRRPTIVVVTKSDDSGCNDRSPSLRSFLERRSVDASRLVTVGHLHESADLHSGIADVIEALFETLPEGPPLYPGEFYTDQEPSFRISEVIRGEALARVREEVPHALYVEVVDLEERGEALWARAFVFVESESQKGIVVGARGNVVASVRVNAERRLKAIFERPVRLSLQVKVRRRWRRNKSIVDKIVY